MHGELELLQGDPLDVAPRVLGALVHCRGVTVRLTEVEAYRGEDDPGSHAFRGETPRTSPMFAGAGHVYAYFTYVSMQPVVAFVGLEKEGRASGRP